MRPPSDKFDVTVIIPTLAAREPELERAIASVRNQKGIAAWPVVVVNGDQNKPELLSKLRRADDLELIQIEEAGVSEARFAGLRHIATKYFCFLVADDDFLEDGLGYGVSVLDDDPSLDAIATNGFREAGGERSDCFEKFSAHTTDPAMDLVAENWLASCGGLFRTATVGREIFAGLPDYFEMTLIAFRLAQSYHIARRDRRTFIVHEGAENRASRSSQYHAAEQHVLKEIEKSARDADIRRALRKKRAAALHNYSNFCRDNHAFGLAWKFHLQSILTAGGWRYLFATRHLMLPGRRERRSQR